MTFETCSVRRIVVAGAVLALPVLVQASGECGYTYEEFRGPPCGEYDAYSIANAINAQGTVVGMARCHEVFHPFTWTREGGSVALPSLGEIVVGSVRATDINDHGDIVGWFDVAGGGTRGFALIDGVYTILAPPVETDGTVCLAIGINNARQVVGWRSIGATELPQTAYMWSEAFGFTDLGPIGYDTSRAYAVNEDGVVTGRAYNHAGDGEGFSWHLGDVLMLGVPPNASGSVARGKWGGTVIPGYLTIGLPPYPYWPTADRPALWHANGTWEWLDLPPQCSNGQALVAAPDESIFIGQCESEWTWGDYRVTLWRDGEVSMLRDLTIPPGDLFQFRHVGDIDAQGRIVVSGNGIGYLLTPYDPPTDLTDDCLTNFADLQIVLANWGAAGGIADIDGDGLVALPDLLQVLTNWTLD